MDTVQNLREVAAELRKLASSFAEREEKRVELDPAKVRDFLIFFGGQK